MPLFDSFISSVEGPNENIYTRLKHGSPNAAAVADALPAQRMLLLKCSQINTTVSSLQVCPSTGNVVSQR